MSTLKDKSLVHLLEMPVSNYTCRKNLLMPSQIRKEMFEAQSSLVQNIRENATTSTPVCGGPSIGVAAASVLPQDWMQISTSVGSFSGLEKSTETEPLVCSMAEEQNAAGESSTKGIPNAGSNIEKSNPNSVLRINNDEPKVKKRKRKNKRKKKSTFEDEIQAKRRQRAEARRQRRTKRPEKYLNSFRASLNARILQKVTDGNTANVDGDLPMGTEDRVTSSSSFKANDPITNLGGIQPNACRTERTANSLSPVSLIANEPEPLCGSNSTTGCPKIRTLHDASVGLSEKNRTPRYLDPTFCGSFDATHSSFQPMSLPSVGDKTKTYLQTRTNSYAVPICDKNSSSRTPSTSCSSAHRVILIENRLDSSSVQNNCFSEVFGKSGTVVTSVQTHLPDLAPLLLNSTRTTLQLEALVSSKSEATWLREEKQNTKLDRLPVRTFKEETSAQLNSDNCQGESSSAVFSEVPGAVQDNAVFQFPSHNCTVHDNFRSKRVSFSGDSHGSAVSTRTYEYLSVVKDVIRIPYSRIQTATAGSSNPVWHGNWNHQDPDTLPCAATRVSKDNPIKYPPERDMSEKFTPPGRVTHKTSIDVIVVSSDGSSSSTETFDSPVQNERTILSFDDLTEANSCHSSDDSSSVDEVQSDSTDDIQIIMECLPSKRKETSLVDSRHLYRNTSPVFPQSRKHRLVHDVQKSSCDSKTSFYSTSSQDKDFNLINHSQNEKPSPFLYNSFESPNSSSGNESSEVTSLNNCELPHRNLTNLKDKTMLPAEHLAAAASKNSHDVHSNFEEFEKIQNEHVNATPYFTAINRSTSTCGHPKDDLVSQQIEYINCQPNISRPSSQLSHSSSSPYVSAMSSFSDEASVKLASSCSGTTSSLSGQSSFCVTASEMSLSKDHSSKLSRIQSEETAVSFSCESKPEKARGTLDRRGNLLTEDYISIYSNLHDDNSNKPGTLLNAECASNSNNRDSGKSPESSGLTRKRRNFYASHTDCDSTQTSSWSEVVSKKQVSFPARLPRVKRARLRENTTSLSSRTTFETATKSFLLKDEKENYIQESIFYDDVLENLGTSRISPPRDKMNSLNQAPRKDDSNESFASDARSKSHRTLGSSLCDRTTSQNRVEINSDQTVSTQKTPAHSTERYQPRDLSNQRDTSEGEVDRSNSARCVTRVPNHFKDVDMFDNFIQFGKTYKLLFAWENV